MKSNIFDNILVFPICLTIFDLNPNVTSAEELSPELKTFYSDYLIDLAEPELVHDRWAQKHNIPAGKGKTIEFRKFEALPELTSPIDEGVTPDGQSLSVTAITASVAQYGGFVTVTDMLELTAIDPVITQSTKMIASQAGRSLDTVTREVLVGGTSVQYAEGQVDSRSELYYTDENDNCNLTVDAVKRAVRFLETMDAPKINGYYCAIIHPNCKYDLMKDPAWIEPHKYVDTREIYDNEIGELYGVRFVQSSRAKKFEGAGANDVDVYATMVFGADAYGTTEITGGGLQHIVMQRGSGGTSDPLSQRATIAWKATKAAERLVEQYMVRIETTATP